MTGEKPIEEIIRMAREAGFCVNEDGSRISTNNSYGILEKELVRFFHMAQAAEREACINLCEELWEKHGWGANAGYAADAIRARGQK